MPAAAETPRWWKAADWPAPANVRAGITTRLGGISRPPYEEFNLALHVGDEPAAVTANRSALKRGLRLPNEPCWLQQVHGKRVVAAAAGPDREADACLAAGPGQVCAILVADCVPLLLTDTAGVLVAAIHAGWRGIAADITGAALAAMGARPERLLAWIGPCIGPRHYAVGADVRSACLKSDPGASGCFAASGRDSWHADLRGLVRHQLLRRGVRSIHGNDLCVQAHPELFYSHRRDGRTGRMAALIWIDGDQA